MVSYASYPKGTENPVKKSLKKRFGKIKKTLDKQISTSYNNQAVAAEAAARKRKSPEKIFKKDKFPVDKLKTA